MSEEKINELEDVITKLNDCLETLKSGKQLDMTQKAFLMIHNL